MDWNIAISDEERSERRLSDATLLAAHQAFRQHGCIIVRGAFDCDHIDMLHQDYVTRLGARSPDDLARAAQQPAPNTVLKVGAARYEVTMPLSGAFGSPAFFAGAIVSQMVDPLLDNDVQLSSLSVVVSCPEAAKQHVHRDYSHLFGHSQIGGLLPVYGINVAVPLVDIDAELGPTAFWPGSHRWPDDHPRELEASMVVETVRRGDIMLIDYRTLHAGMPNRSQRMRPIAYLVYVRPWFFDEANHRKRIPLRMSTPDYQACSEKHQKLLMRAFTYAVRRDEATSDPVAG